MFLLIEHASRPKDSSTQSAGPCRQVQAPGPSHNCFARLTRPGLLPGRCTPPSQLAPTSTSRFLTCTKFLQVNNFERRKNCCPTNRPASSHNNTIPATIPAEEARSRRLGRSGHRQRCRGGSGQHRAHRRGSGVRASRGGAIRRSSEQPQTARRSEQHGGVVSSEPSRRARGGERGGLTTVNDRDCRSGSSLHASFEARGLLGGHALEGTRLRVCASARLCVCVSRVCASVRLCV